MEQDGGGTALPGRRVRADTRHPVYRGIRYRGGKWVSEIREPRKSNRIWLGTYPTPEMAAAAYDAAASALRGAEAALNFPAAAAARPAPPSCSPDDIRAAASAAAAAAAAMVGPGPGPGEGCAAGHHHRLPSGASASEQRAGEVTRRIVDEDDVFQMPRLLEGMAEGLMMSPPRLSPTADGGAGSSSLEEDGNDGGGGGLSLWDHS
jgi:hypothetical protein